MLNGFLYDLSNWKINSGDEFWTLVHDRYFVLKCVVHRIYACVSFLMYFDVCQNEILIKCHVETRKTDSNSEVWYQARFFESQFDPQNWQPSMNREKLKLSQLLLLHNYLSNIFFFFFILLQKIFPVLCSVVGPTRLFGVFKLTTHFLEGIYAYGLFTAV